MQLTDQQAEQVHRVIIPTVGYLHRLRCRLDQLGTPPADPLYRLTGAAFDALQALAMHLHYAAVDAARRRG